MGEAINWGKYIETNEEYVMQSKVKDIEEEERRTHTQTHNMNIHQHIHKHIYGHTYTRPHTHPYTPRHKEKKKPEAKHATQLERVGRKKCELEKWKDGRADPRTGSHREMLYLQSICEYKKKKREKRKIFNDEKEV